jgi:hypothetical protein
MTIRPLVICALLVTVHAGVAHAKEYSADRFDSRVEVLRGGALRVTETVLIRFVDGTFTQFYREIPSRRTDGLEIVSASMDGALLPAGDGPGHVQIRQASRTRVTWHFTRVSGSSHLFELTYIVRGAVRQEDDADVVAWRALPSQHAYRVDSSAIDFALPAEPIAPPSLESRRVGTSSVAIDGARARIDARSVRRNGWVETWIRLPRGSVIDVPPHWQQRELQVQKSSTVWVVLSAIVLIGGLTLLFGVRQGYDVPARDVTGVTSGPALPDTLPPALAGALVANGKPRLEHAMAALFSLADRGEVTIEEQPRSLGQRNFVASRGGSGRPLAEHERRVLDIIFTGRGGGEQSVGLGKARGRLTRHFKKFSTALEGEMAAAGLMDDGREAVRRRFFKIGIILIAAACITPLATVFLAEAYGAWPMLIPVVLAILGVVALICHSAHTPLSNTAVRRSEHWRAFRRYLREIARDRETSPADATLRQWLPFVVALGLAPAWAAYLKKRRSGAPPWFRAAADADSGQAFAAFVGIGGAGHTNSPHGTHAGGGGAAGGGSSGAH